MSREDRLKRILSLRRSRVEACRAAHGQAQAEVDAAQAAVDKTQEQLQRTEAMQRAASKPGGIDLGRVLALEEGVLGVRQTLRRSEAFLAVTERRRDQVQARLEVVSREARGSEKALERCAAEAARAERRRTWSELIAFSLRAGGPEEEAA